MGLDTSHNCWHGSYTGFARWRNDIGRIIGWGTEERLSGAGEGYMIPEGRVPEQAAPADEIRTEDGETYTIHWSQAYDNSVWLGHWDTDPEDVIDVLMVHSDCEGIIPHRFLDPLVMRLLEIGKQQDGWYLDATKLFIAGLMDANDRGEDVDFH